MPTVLRVILLLACLSGATLGLMFAYIWLMSDSHESGTTAVVLLTASGLSLLTLVGENSQH